MTEAIDKALIDIGLTVKIPTEVFNCIDSTSTEARRKIKAGASLPFLIAAREQTNGRGRQGKTFYSPADSGIYFSIAVDASKIPESFPITCAICVAAMRAILNTTGIRTEIKWVNDLYLGSKKVCGILSEKTGSAVIIGIGINVNNKAFPAELQDIACSLESNVSKSLIISEVTNEIFRILNEPSTLFMEEYRCNSLVLGKEISFTVNGKLKSGKAASIDNTGALIVITAHGEEKLFGGEITVRLKK